jgi:hypothetical protein
MGRTLSNLGLLTAIVVAAFPGTLHAQEANEWADADTWFEEAPDVEVVIEGDAPEADADADADSGADTEPVLNPYDEDGTTTTKPRSPKGRESAASPATKARQALAVAPPPTAAQSAEQAMARVLDDASTAFAAGAVISFIGTLALVGVLSADANTGGLDLKGEGNNDLAPAYVGTGVILLVGHMVAIPPLTIILTAKGEKNGAKGVARIGPNGIGYSGTF